MQNRWETDVSQAEVPKSATLGRNRNRWATTTDAQNPPLEDNQLATAPQGNPKLLKTRC